MPGDWRGGASWLIVAWVAGMILMPIVQRRFGEPGLLAGVVVSVLLQASLAVLFLVRASGWRRTVFLVVIVAFLAWAAEALGSQTGVPFGAYHYTDELQPQLLGVPLLIPAAWLMMLPPAWGVAQRLTGRAKGLALRAQQRLYFAQ